MSNPLSNRLVYIAVPFLLASSGVFAETDDSVESLRQELQRMQQEIDELRAENDDSEQMRDIAEKTYDEKDADKVNVGGAVRFNYSLEDYDRVAKERGGNFSLDTIRLNFDSNVGDILMSAEYRFYEYMDVVHHAWIGYDFTDTLQGQVGINQVPFGIQPYASHNFFFSSNYYVGLEDDYDFGVKFIHDDGPLNLQAAFYFNDELGMSDSNERYSYDITGLGDQTDENVPSGSDRGYAVDDNITNLRAAWTFGEGTDFSTEVGVSGQYGDMVNDDGKDIGDQYAYAGHIVGNYGPWNLQLQASHYNYKAGGDWNRMVVGAYAADDTIATSATTYTANLAYDLPVNWGPVSNLTFYNDHSYMTDKSDGIADTWMNVTGMSVTAGNLFTYFDLVHGKNQPFIGGSMGAPESDSHNTRFNVNVGYYF